MQKMLQASCHCNILQDVVFSVKGHTIYDFSEGVREEVILKDAPHLKMLLIIVSPFLSS